LMSKSKAIVSDDGTGKAFCSNGAPSVVALDAMTAINNRPLISEAVVTRNRYGVVDMMAKQYALARFDHVVLCDADNVSVD